MSLKFQTSPTSLFWTYLVLGLWTAFAVHQDWDWLEFPLRIISLIVLGILYYVVSPKRDWVYFAGLLFAGIANILLNLDNLVLVVTGITLFVLYRAFCGFLIFKYTEKIFYFTLIVGFILFFLPMLYLLFTSEQQSMAINIIGAINIFVTALIGAISLSNYIMDSSFKETWLLISSLLFITIACMYMIEKFYLSLPMYGPLRVIVLMSAHYFYYLYLIRSERQNR